MIENTIKNQPYKICDKILQLIEETYGISESTIRSRRRSHAESKARWIVFWLVHACTDFTRTHIGHLFNTDHTGVSFGIKKIDALKKEDLKFSYELQKMQMQLLNLEPNPVPKYKYIPPTITSIEKLVEPIIHRKCLNCGTEFIADGRFNRICKRCKKSEDYYDGFNDTTVAL